MALVVIYYSDGTRLSATVDEDGPTMDSMVELLKYGGSDVKAADKEGHITYD